jgi:phosphoglycolate phosphatase-like HAD superfamily hydrolase
MNKKWIIFDIDGTLADSRHRSHHIRIDAMTPVTHDSGSTGVVQSVIVDDPCGETIFEILWDKGDRIKHRYSEVERWRKIDWDAWDADTLLDTPIEPTIRVLKALRSKRADGASFMFLTARGERARELTVKWLKRHDLFLEFLGDELVMRAADDIRRDTDIKRELIEKHRAEGDEFLFAFEDRRLVANMLRELGIFVFHVADYD